MITPRQAILLGLLCIALGCGEKPKIVIRGPHVIEVDFAEAKDPTRWSTRQWKTDRIVVHGDRIVWDVGINCTHTVRAGETGGLWRIRVDEDELRNCD